MFLFGEHIQAGALNLAVETLALALLAGGVLALSHSRLLVGEEEWNPANKPGGAKVVGEPSAHPCAAQAQGRDRPDQRQAYGTGLFGSVGTCWSVAASRSEGIRAATRSS
jgi:hypothetical protein